MTVSELEHNLSHDTPGTPCENCRLLTVQIARLMAVQDQIAYLISASYVTGPPASPEQVVSGHGFQA